MSHPPKFPSHAKPEPTRIESLAAKEPNAEGRKPGCVVECCKVLPRGHAAHPLLISAPIMSVRPGGRRADMRPSVGSLGEPAVSAMCSARRSKMVWVTETSPTTTPADARDLSRQVGPGSSRLWADFPPPRHWGL